MEDSQFEVVGTSANEAYFKWTLNLREFVIRKAYSIDSPKFQIMLYTDCSEWMITLILREQEQGTRYLSNRGHVQQYLPILHSAAKIVLLKAAHQNIVVNVDFKLYDSWGQNLDSLSIVKAKLHNGASIKSYSQQSWGCNVTMFITLKVFLNDHPALISELPISNSESSVSKSSISNTKSSIEPDKPCYTTLFQPNLMSSIIDDFAKLRINGEFSDFTISVRGKEFRAHQIILAARSQVFSTMFKHYMKEAKSGKVEVEDIEPEVFEEFLNFIYTGKANINAHASKLLAAADKYDVQDLKAFCENELIKDLSKENCFKILNLSELYSATNLKKEAINFIVFNDRVSDKNGLAQISNLSLSKELIEAFVNHKK